MGAYTLFMFRYLRESGAGSCGAASWNADMPFSFKVHALIPHAIFSPPKGRYAHANLFLSKTDVRWLE